MTTDARQVYGFGPFTLDRHQRVLLRDGEPVPLRPKDFDMLLVLVENNRRIVEKDELMKRVWPETFVEEANLSHHVFTLRKALGEEKGDARYIETVPRRGYRFVASVSRVGARADDSTQDSFESESEVRTEASDPAFIQETRTVPAVAVRRWHMVLALSAVVLLAGAAYGWWVLNRVPAPSITRLAITLGPEDAFTDAPPVVVALSPDGTKAVYAANRGLYLRFLDRLEATPIPGIDSPGLASARVPFFSPDGQWIGFWEKRQLKKVSIHGGPPVTLCDLGPPPYGATWAADDTILIGHGSRGVWRVSAEEGATPEPIIKVGNGQRAHGSQLLPDGRTVLFTLADGPNWDEAKIVVQPLDGGAPRTILSGTDARYLPSRHLVYALGDTVLGVPFDVRSLTISGTPVPVLQGVRRRQGSFGSAAQFAVSSSGTLAYLESVPVFPLRRRLVWVDRLGREEALLLEPRAYTYPRISPDGERLALDIRDEANRDIWVWHFARQTLTRVTCDAAGDVEPVWTRDGKRLVFLSLRTGMGNLFWQSADGSGTAEQLTSASRIRGVDTTTPDRKSLIVRESDGAGTFDLALLPLPPTGGAASPSSETKPLVTSRFLESNAEVSPDGRWLAYQSDNSGSAEIYLRPFPGVQTSQWQVSTTGGTEPLWTADSRELFYRSPTGAVMRVAITPGAPVPPSPPTQLFPSASYAVAERGVAGLARRTYDVSLDGRQFLMLKNIDAGKAPVPQRIVVVQNWFEELKAKLPRN